MRDEVEVLEKNQAILKPQIFFSYIFDNFKNR